MKFLKNFKSVLAKTTFIFAALLITQSSVVAQNANSNGGMLDLKSIQALAKSAIEHKLRLCEQQNQCYYFKSVSLNQWDAKTRMAQIEFEFETFSSTQVLLPMSLTQESVVALELNSKPSYALAMSGQSIVLAVNSANTHKAKVTLYVPESVKEIAFNTSSVSVVKSNSSQVQVTPEENAAQRYLRFTPQGSDIKNSPTAQQSLSVGNIYYINREIFTSEDIKMKTTLSSINEDLASVKSTIELDLPLMSSEKLLDRQASSQETSVRLSNSDARSSSYESIIKSTAVEFKNTTQIVQIVRVNLNQMWTIKEYNIKPFSQSSFGAQFFLLPQESLKFSLSKKVATSGASVAVVDNATSAIVEADKVRYSTVLNAHSSIAQIVQVNFSDMSNLKSVSIKDASGIVSDVDLSKTPQPKIQLLAGENKIELQFTQEQSADFLWTPVSVALKFTDSTAIDNKNHSLKLQASAHKVFLWSTGSELRPSIILWSIAIFTLAIAWVSLKLSVNKLAISSVVAFWAVLMGFSQVGVASVFAAWLWFFIFAYKSYYYSSIAKKSWLYNTLQVGVAVYGFFLAQTLFNAISTGLLGTPKLYIQGAMSQPSSWYFYSLNSSIESINIYWAGVMGYKVLMLVWSVWMAVSILSWARVWWQQYSSPVIWMKGAQDKTSRSGDDSQRDDFFTNETVNKKEIDMMDNTKNKETTPQEVDVDDFTALVQQIQKSQKSKDIGVVDLCKEIEQSEDRSGESAKTDKKQDES